ncbi:MAG: invasion associated locus B family protein [Halocynthiibacter sp.]
MKSLLTTTAFLIAGSFAAPVFAQSTDTTTAPAPTATEATSEAPKTEPAAQADEAATPAAPATPKIGDAYIRQVNGAWEVRCIKGEDVATEECQIFQAIKDNTGQPLAEVTLFKLPENGKAVAGGTSIVPLETLLTANLSLRIDKAKPKGYPFSWCSPTGCVSRMGFTAADIKAFKAGKEAFITVVPAVAPDKTVTGTFSLKGFTASYDALNAPKGLEVKN